jgi:hypothetical protein
LFVFVFVFVFVFSLQLVETATVPASGLASLDTTIGRKNNTVNINTDSNTLPSNLTATVVDIATIVMNATVPLTAVNATSSSSNAALASVAPTSAVELQPPQLKETESNPGHNNVPQLLTAEDCFASFNPVSQTSYESTVQSWADAIIALALNMPKRL